MDFQEFLLSLVPRLKPHWIPLSVGITGFALLLYGLISLFPSSSDEIVIHTQEDALATTSAKVTVIMVDVSGAVKNPGVYELKVGDRIQDALQKAGGLENAVNQEYISKNINLAQKITDGAKIYIPYEGEQGTGSTGITSSTSTTGSEVNINTVSSSTLEDLPGIGKVTAERIINGRPYGSTQDLLDKKIVGSKVFEQIKDFVTVN